MYSNPEIYDILHTSGTSEEIDTYIKIVSNYLQLNKSLRWLEPACGSGRCLRLLKNRGFDVVGFDLDPNMIEYCKAALGDAVFQADMANFTSHLDSKFDIAFNPYNSIRHLDCDKAILSHLKQVAQSLNRGGLYLVGMSLSNYETDIPEEDIWTGSRGDCKVTQVVNYLPPDSEQRIETVISHIVTENPDENIDETYQLRSYDKSEWAEVIAKSGLELIASYDSIGVPAADRKLIYQIDVLKRI